MMSSPNAYISQFENSVYLDLIKERNHLIDYIQSYENSEIAGDRSGEEGGIHPQPDVRYQMYLEYMGKICRPFNGVFKATLSENMATIYR